MTMGKKKKSAVTHNVNDKETSNVPTNSILIIGVVLAIGVLHSQYLSHLFENDRYFSALSPLERELSFRTEMGLYYSYYKTIIDSSSITDGIKLLLYDNVTEYPNTINTLQRFNLYPEVVLSIVYRGLKVLTKTLKVNTVNCFKIERGNGQAPIDTCTGITVAPYFYVNSVFLLNSLLPIAIFLLSYYLWESSLSGVVSTLMFFYNHGEATRVMWTPPLRESFSMPFLFLQFLVLTQILKLHKPPLIHYILYFISTLMFMIPWQFAQFTLLTQVLCLSIVYCLNLISPKKFAYIILTLMVALLVNSLLQFGNVLLLSSFFAVCLPVCFLTIIFHRFFQYFKWIPLIAFFQLVFILCGTVAIKILISYFVGIKDDAHIGAILLSKFTDYEDFHTQLYTCSAEFDFISLIYFGKLTLTLLIPLTLLGIGKVILQTVLFLFKNKPMPSSSEDESHQKHTAIPGIVEATILYHALQCMSFTFMAVLIMRLKLFLTPQMSILAGFIASKKAFKLSTKQRYWLIGFTVTLASISGFWNLNEQMNIIGEYNDPQMEELIMWIKSNTPKDAVFAGAMPLMATIKLSAGRPIVNHPHYENAAIRERTLLVYTIYSQRDSQVVYSNLKSLGVQYVIVERAWCTNSKSSFRSGCDFSDIYLKMFPEDKSNIKFCLSVLNNKLPLNGFKKLYSNQNYVVLLLS